MVKTESFNLFHHSWSLAIIDKLFENKGAKLVFLHKNLGLSRSVLENTVRRLIDFEIIFKNPGYGHPMRPEYLLTELGEKLAPFCKELLRHINKKKHIIKKQSKWTFPIMFMLGDQNWRFNEIKTSLHPVTSRALSLELKSMAETKLVKRHIIDNYPPTVLYGSGKEALSFIDVYSDHKKIVHPYCFSEN